MWGRKTKMSALSLRERNELSELFASLEYARKPLLLRFFSHFSSKKFTTLLKTKKLLKIAKSKIVKSHSLRCAG